MLRVKEGVEILFVMLIYIVTMIVERKGGGIWRVNGRSGGELAILVVKDKGNGLLGSMDFICTVMTAHTGGG